MNIPQSEIARIRKLKVFTPNSQDAIILFRIAAKAANLPESWATNKNLHYILNRESAGGKVGILNYTLKGKVDLSDFKDFAIKNSKMSSKAVSSHFRAASNASGLGQLLLVNVDKYYPSGRNGIGDPIEEAIGFMKYIQDRYGNPDVAKSIYNKK